MNHTTLKNWNLKGLLLCNLLAIFLIGSLTIPFTKHYWDILDVAFFKLINGSLEGHLGPQIFWAIANHKYADWFEDLCILGFFIAYVRQAASSLRLRRVFELIFCVLCIACVIIFINDMLFRQHWKIPRLSPTRVMDSSIHISHSVPWLHIKTGSSNSFPGDHATTAILFAAGLSYLAGWRMGLIACLYGAFLCVPRLIIGAHWLSDVIVGSGSIALLFLSWAFCSPLFQRFVNGCEYLYQKLRRKVIE